jgi:putative CocE/NonD family hydrolase
MPKVQIYVIGRDEWRAEQEWPLARTQVVAYYLHSQGHANSRSGDGDLALDLPGDEPADRFAYDPATPVPTVGGPVCCTGTPDAPAGGFDQSEVEMRQDVLVYSSPALVEGVEATGPIQLVLYVSSSARDTDFTAKLVDVYPDGRAFNVTEGIMRARYRHGYHQTAWMEPEEVYELTIDLQVTSNYFCPGHCIRLEVSSSSFPRFARNLNTSGNGYDETSWEVAHNQVHHSRAYPSRLLLPVIP